MTLPRVILSLREFAQSVRCGAELFRPVLGKRFDKRPRSPREALDNWLAALGRRSLPPTDRHVLVTALRNPTWICWAAYAACVLRLMGVRTTMVFSGSQVRAAEPQWVPRKYRFWDGVPGIPGLRLLDMDSWVDSDPNVVPGLATSVDGMVRAALAYDLHIEEQDVLEGEESLGGAIESLRERNLRAGNGLWNLLAKERFDSFVLVSGLIAETHGLLQAARASSQPTVCVEGWAWRAGHMIYNHDAPALEYNVGAWMRVFGPWSREKDCEVDAYLKFVDGQQSADGHWLDSFYRVQRESVSATLPPRVREFLATGGSVLLAAPNVIGDSSMLVRERGFAGQRDWIERLILHVRQRPHLRLVVRAHPAEQWVGPGKCILRMGDIAARAARGVPNVLVIHSQEPLNTFSLLPFSSLGLVYLSSAGVEMTARGLPVIAAGRPKYEGLGIVAEPLTQGDYFAALDSMSSKPSRPSVDSISAARKYLYLVFKGFSFQAQGRDFKPMSLDLERPAAPIEHDAFFRILAGIDPGVRT